MDVRHPKHQLGEAEFTRTVPAVAAEAGQLTKHVSGWLDHTGRIDAQRSSDIALATYEALANCADHAYRNETHAGAMTIQVSHDCRTDTVRICVTDHGSWITPDTQTARSSRGRGLRLMQALCDDFTVNGTNDGTTVCLHFHCPSSVARLPANQSQRGY
jgi:serine/threonine-protein kinase RsbW